MPQTYLTEAQRQEAAEKNLRERIIRIFSAAMVAVDKDRAQTAKESRISYQAFNARMRGDVDFSAPQLARIADVLRLDILSRAALLGSREKCRFEPGYVEATPCRTCYAERYK